MIILHRQVASPPIKIKSGFFLFPLSPFIAGQVIVQMG